MNASAVVVLTSFPHASAAKRILDGLLERRLAACVQTWPVQSAYHWKGSIQREAEIVALIKTRASLYPKVETFLKAAHPYEVPEIIQLPVTGGSKAYLGWLAAETK